MRAPPASLDAHHRPDPIAKTDTALLTSLHRARSTRCALVGDAFAGGGSCAGAHGAVGAVTAASARRGRGCNWEERVPV
jgi:hypothetical protein